MGGKFRIEFKDSSGARLSIVLREKKNLWLTYIIHSKTGQGATEEHKSVKAARARWAELERQVLALGWPRRVVLKDPVPAPMHRTDEGGRLFRDARTGEYFADTSASRPLESLPLAQFPTQQEDIEAFGMDDLPFPGGVDGQEDCEEG